MWLKKKESNCHIYSDNWISYWCAGMCVCLYTIWKKDFYFTANPSFKRKIVLRSEEQLPVTSNYPIKL